MLISFGCSLVAVGFSLVVLRHGVVLQLSSVFSSFFPLSSSGFPIILSFSLTCPVCFLLNTLLFPHDVPLCSFGFALIFLLFAFVFS